MDNKKFEQLIELIINENEEQARELFHEIVVEKSREIYESIMDEEMMDEEPGMVGEVGDLMDEISAEEAGGMTEAEDEDMEFGDEEGDEEVEINASDMDDSDEHEDIEDAVIRIEDKLDQIMAEFEEIMGKDEEADEMDSEEGDEEEEGEEQMMEADDELDEEDVMEAIALKKVSVTHGDNGANAKSIALHEPKVKVAGVSPVRFSGHDESVPTGPKGPSNAYAKGETQVKGAGSFKNAPAQASQDLEKAPKAHTAQATGVNTKSPVSESKRSTKRIVK